MVKYYVRHSHGYGVISTVLPIDDLDSLHSLKGHHEGGDSLPKSTGKSWVGHTSNGFTYVISRSYNDQLRLLFTLSYSGNKKRSTNLKDAMLSTTDAILESLNLFELDIEISKAELSKLGAKPIETIPFNNTDDASVSRPLEQRLKQPHLE